MLPSSPWLSLRLWPCILFLFFLSLAVSLAHGTVYVSVCVWGGFYVCVCVCACIKILPKNPKGSCSSALLPRGYEAQLSTRPLYPFSFLFWYDEENTRDYTLCRLTSNETSSP